VGIALDDQYIGHGMTPNEQTGRAPSDP